MEGYKSRDFGYDFGMSTALEIAKTAKDAFIRSQLIESSERVSALHEIRRALQAQKMDILAANAQDLQVCLPMTKLFYLKKVGRPARSRCRAHVRIFAEATGLGQRR